MVRVLLDESFLGLDRAGVFERLDLPSCWSLSTRLGRHFESLWLGASEGLPDLASAGLG